MYLGLHLFGGSGGTLAADAGVVAQTTDAGSGKPKPKRTGKRPGRNTGAASGGNGRQTAGPDFEPDTGAASEGNDDSGERPPPLISLTAADRGVEWRGDSTSISRKIDLNAPGDARPLEESEYNPVVIGHTDAVRQCVITAAANTDLRGTIQVKMVVEGNGKVSRTQLQAPHYMFEKGLLGCAQRALSQLKFPATGAPTLVMFPINFS